MTSGGASTSGLGVADELAKLHALKSRGGLSEAEYAKAKRHLLAAGVPARAPAEDTRPPASRRTAFLAMAGGTLALGVIATAIILATGGSPAFVTEDGQLVPEVICAKTSICTQASEQECLQTYREAGLVSGADGWRGRDYQVLVGCLRGATLETPCEQLLKCLGGAEF